MDVRVGLSKTSSEQEVWLHDLDCVWNVFLRILQCVWCYLTCENGKIRVIWQTDGSTVMVEADNGSSCCVWGFSPHSSSWMFPLTSDLSIVWSDTSFHRMTAETFSLVPGATADASAVSISCRREKKTLEPTLCRMMWINSVQITFLQLRGGRATHSLDVTLFLRRGKCHSSDVIIWSSWVMSSLANTCSYYTHGYPTWCSFKQGPFSKYCCMVHFSEFQNLVGMKWQ